MTSQITSDSNGSGKIKWTFSDADDDFDFLSKNQTLTLTYDIKVSDNHGGTAVQTVKVTVTGTDDKPVINMTTVATVTEQANHTLSLTPDTVHIALNFTDDDLTNTGHTATVLSASATGNTIGNPPRQCRTDVVLRRRQRRQERPAPAPASSTLRSRRSISPSIILRPANTSTSPMWCSSTTMPAASRRRTSRSPWSAPMTRRSISADRNRAHLTEGQNLNSSGNLHCAPAICCSPISICPTPTRSRPPSRRHVRAAARSRSPNAQLLAAFSTSLTPDSTGHLIGDVDWNFALQNNAASFLGAGETLTLIYHVAVTDPSLAHRLSQDVTITILGTNHPVVITSGPESASVSELADTTGSAAIDTTTTVPAGTLASPMPTPATPTPSRRACIDVGRRRSGGDAGGSCGGADHHAAQFHRHRHRKRGLELQHCRP